MAYLTHNAYQGCNSNAAPRNVKIGRYAATVAVGLAAAGLVVMSSGAFAPAGDRDAAVAKGDRLATADGSGNSEAARIVDGVQRDEARQIMTVVRGATVPFSASSPYLNDKR